MISERLQQYVDHSEITDTLFTVIFGLLKVGKFPTFMTVTAIANSSAYFSQDAELTPCATRSVVV
jgi:hypothetical protein